MTYNVFSGTLNPTQSINQFRSNMICMYSISAKLQMHLLCQLQVLMPLNALRLWKVVKGALATVACD